jgi:hypothetical protein
MTSTRMTGQWIWTGEEDVRPKNRFTWFRRVVDLEHAPRDAALRFAADSTAQLRINGVPVLRKVTRYDEKNVRADVLHVARHLRPGRNVVVVLHHNWGDIVTFQRTSNTRAGLLLSSEWINSDEDWRWKVADEFDATTFQFAGANGGTPRIRFPIRWDATGGSDPLEYHTIDYDDSGWGRTVVVKDGPWPSTVRDVETPPQRESLQIPLSVLAAGSAIPESREGSVLAGSMVGPEALARVEAASLLSGGPYVVSGEAGQTKYVTVDMQRPVHGYPTLTVETDCDVSMVLGFGELPESPHNGRTLISSDGWIDVDAVVAEGYADFLRPARSRRTYEFPDERTARWVTLHITFTSPGRVTITDLGVIKSQYPVEFRGSFACGDERLEQIVKLCLVHAELTMSDAYVDTPGREDGQWIEDARPRATLASRWFGDSRLRRMMIRTLAEGQRDDGNLHPFFPSNYPYGPSQWDWTLQWIGMVADEYRWSADAELVTEYFPTIERILAAITNDIGADGVWRSSHVFGDIRNSAPLSEGDSSGIVTPWVIDRLRDSADLAVALGNMSQATTWSRLADRVSEAFREHHVVTHGDHPAPLVADLITKDGLPVGFSQAGQIIPLYNGLFTPDEATAVIELVFPVPYGSPPEQIAPWNNPTWSYRALRALSSNGFHERAVAHLIERYSTYLPAHPKNDTELVLQGPYGGPLPEYWIGWKESGCAPGEINQHQPVDATGSHGWGAVPLLWLHEFLLGVTVTSAGGSTLRIQPNAAGLPFVTGTTVTPKGAVYVHYEPAEPRLHLEIPEGVTASLRLPPEFSGTTVREQNSRLQIADAEQEIEVAAGRWVFASVAPSWRVNP